MTLVAATFDTLTMDMSVSGTFRCQVNAATAVTKTDNVPTGALLPYVSVETTTSAQRTLDLDYAWLALTGLGR